MYKEYVRFNFYFSVEAKRDMVLNINGFIDKTVTSSYILTHFQIFSLKKKIIIKAKQK